MACSSSRLAVGFDPVFKPASFSYTAQVMFQSYLPPELWDSNKQVEVESWLNAYIHSALDRKLILLDWCKFYGFPFTKEKAVAIGAEQLPPP